MSDLTQIGRLALRHEAENWNAYYALNGVAVAVSLWVNFSADLFTRMRASVCLRPALLEIDTWALAVYVGRLPLEGGNNMTTMITMHQVANYDEWRPNFDKHEAKQKEAGLSNPRVYRLAESPNTLALFFDVADRQKAEAFTRSPDLKSVMERAGVVGKPEFLFTD
jgi:hypothetical protein